MKYFLVVWLLVCGAVAHAAAPQLVITWSAPTQFTDGTPLQGGITYQVYVGPAGNEVKVATPPQAPPLTLSVIAPGVTCVQVTATVNGRESARTPEKCVTILAPAPNAPTAVTATVK